MNTPFNFFKNLTQHFLKNKTINTFTWNTLSLSELTPIMSYMKLTHLGSDASIYFKYDRPNIYLTILIQKYYKALTNH